MAVPVRFTPLGQSSSKNGLGPIFAPEDLPDPGTPAAGPIDIELTHFRFSDRLAYGVDWEYDENGNLLAIDGSRWLNQQVAKTIQESPDPNGPNPDRGTVLAGAIGQKRLGTFVKDIIAGNVRAALLREILAIQVQPGVTDDQIVKDIVDVEVNDASGGDPREVEVFTLLRTRSGKISPVGNILSI